jgi:hypothetical protein
MRLRDGIDLLRNPQYTGANRCVPCTVVNAALGGVAALVAVLVLGRAVSWRVGALAGAAVGLLAGGSIYLRGYLLPGTPRLTAAYVPDWLLRLFDKETDTTTPVDDDFEMDAALLRAGVVEICEGGDDLCLTGGFRSAWNDQLANVQDDDASRERLARLLDIDADQLALEEHGTALVARADGVGIGQWESRAALLADVAAANALPEWMDEWSALDLRHRSRLLYGLRLFLERCPACEGDVLTEEDTVESCCRSVDVVAASCGDCGARVFEMEHSGEAASAP